MRVADSLTTCVVLLCVSSAILPGQKPALDHSSWLTWPRLESGQVSNDGKYVSYVITVPKTGQTLVVHAVDRMWERMFPGASQAVFTEDSRHVVFHVGTDSVGVLSLMDDSVRYVESISGYKTPRDGDGEWLAYQRNDSTHALVLHSMRTGVNHVYAGVTTYDLSDNGQAVVMQVAREAVEGQALVWVNLADGHTDTLARGRRFAFVAFRDGEPGVAFLVVDSLAGERLVTLRYYVAGMDSAMVVVDAHTAGMSGLWVSDENVVRFSHQAQDIFFYVQPRSTADRPTPDTGASVEILSSRNAEHVFMHSRGPFLAVVHLQPVPRVVRLQLAQDDDGLEFEAGDAYVLASSNVIGDERDYRWRVTARPDLNLVSTIDGSRTLLQRRFIPTPSRPAFSPRGRYIIWFDKYQRQLVTYDIVERRLRHITTPPVQYREDYADIPVPRDVVGWMDDETQVLVQTADDIWAVDPKGMSVPINLTGTGGAGGKIVFRRIDFNGSQAHVFQPGDTLILSATNDRTKANGFYRLVLKGRGQLTSLVMGPKAYLLPGGCGAVEEAQLTVPIKAKHASLYLLTAQSATEYPNYYVTSDFRRLTPVTNLTPQENYNWYRTEPVHWRLPDGRPIDGVLYKPENFDPHRKYPVVFDYYDKSSQALNCFLHPVLSSGRMNVPWFVSNGYLILAPDIDYTLGHPGRSALNSVLSAAAHLSRFPWVNAKKMGIQGHSHGGFETYYIATHSSRFAAAAPAEGTTNLVADYTLLFGAWYYERGQGRIGASLWERPDLYIENSAIFSADQVTTPLLMLANTGDEQRHGFDGHQMLIALQRLGKPAWLLDYHGEGHTLDSEHAQLDYSIRLGQFFDYYLKGARPPVWMTRSISAEPGGTDTGLALDTTGARP